MTTACTYPVMEGIEVLTRTEKVLRARRMMIELILAMCPGDKLIQDMAKEMGVRRSVLRRRRRTVSSVASAEGSVKRWSGPMRSTLHFEETEGR